MEGVNLFPLEDQIETGVAAINHRLVTGRLKVFSTCTNWLREYRVYHRDKDDNVVDGDNRLMRATRYWMTGAKDYARVQQDGDFPTTPVGPADRRAGI